MGEFSLNLIAILYTGPRIITVLSLTETTYMGINSQGTSGEAKLEKKYGPAAQVTRHEEILIQGIMIQTEMLMKSDKTKRCTYMDIALPFLRQLARISTNIVNSGHRPVNAEKIQSTCCPIAPKVAASVRYACAQIIV